jgi:lipopolysaccharide exporter
MSDGLHSGAVLAKTARGTGWIIGWRMTTRLLGLVNTVTLVRLLLPGDFGLVALGASFAQAIETFGYIGLQDSLIRDKAPTRAQYDTAFTLGLLRSACTGLAVVALAVPAGHFFNEPRLAAITLALGIGIILDGFSNVGAVDFRRDFAFQKEFVQWVVPRVASIVLSITVALVWRSYWALVVGILSQRVLRVLLSYTMHPYRPRLHVGAWRAIMGYSTWAWVLSLMSIVRDRTATILIGRMLGPTPVGLFSLGFELASLPTTELVEPLARAAFSGFSATRNQGHAPGEVFVRMVASMALITVPAGIGVALIADPVVRLAFGKLWVAAVPLVQMLGVCGALTVFGTLGSVLFRVYGQQRLVFQVSLAVEIVRVAPLFSVIVPTRNRPALLARALASVRGQVGADFEIIVVDDGNTEEFAAALGAVEQSLAEGGRMLHLARRAAGHGPSYAVNSGAAAAGGRYLCFLDDDDEWIDDGHLARAGAIIAEARQAPDLLLFLQQARSPDGRALPGPIWLEDLMPLPAREATAGPRGSFVVDAAMLMRSGNFCHLNTIMVRRDFFAAVGGLDERLRYENDRAFYLRCVDQARCMLYVPLTVALHHVPDPAQQTNASTIVTAREKLLAQLGIFERAGLMAEHRVIRRQARRQTGYTYKKLALAFRRDGRDAEALACAMHGLAAGFTLRWLAMTLVIALRAATARPERVRQSVEEADRRRARLENEINSDEY